MESVFWAHRQSQGLLHLHACICSQIEIDPYETLHKYVLQCRANPKTGH